MHFVAALDDVARGPRRPVPLRGRGHRGRGRLRAGHRRARRDAAAPGPGARQRLGQPAQRPARALAPPQRRRRPRDLPRRPTTRRCRATSLALAGALEGWSRRCERADDVARDAADAVGAALGPPGRVATLVAAAPTPSWDELAAAPRRVARRGARRAVRRSATPRSAPPSRALRSGRAALLVGGAALGRRRRWASPRASRRRGRRRAAARDLPRDDGPRRRRGRRRAPHLPQRVRARPARGRGAPWCSSARATRSASSPTPTWRATSSPRAARSSTSPRPGTDARAALAALADALGAPRGRGARRRAARGRPTGRSRARRLAAAVGATLPEGVVVVDESNTAGVHLLGATRFSPPHRWLTPHRRVDRLRAAPGGGRGGGVGRARPVPRGRRVDDVHAPGALDDGARGPRRHGGRPGQPQLRDPRARAPARRRAASARPAESLLRPRRPRARPGRGGPLPRACPRAGSTTAEALADALARSYATPGPTFIEAVLPPGL